MKKVLRNKSLTLITAVAASAMLLSACSGSGSTDSSGAVDGKGQTLDVLVNVNSAYPEEQKNWMTDIAAKFKQQTGAELKFETFASANDELTKVQTSVVAGQGPDVYSLGTTFTPTAYATGAFVKLGDAEWAKVGGKDRFNPAALGISGPDAQNQVGVPFVSRPFVMAYNTELFKAAGLDKPASTWDGLAAQAKQLTGNGNYGMAVAYKDGFDPWKFIWAMAAEAGNPLVDGNQAKLDDPAVQKAYQSYFGWLNRDKVVDPASVGWSNSQALAAFAQGKTGIFPITTATAAKTLDASAVKGKYAFALMPTVAPGQTERPANGIEAASILSGDNLVVADYSKNKDLAFAYIKLVTSKDEQLNYNKIFGDLPANAEGLKAIDNPLFGPITEAATKSHATPFTGAWGDIQLALTNVVVQSIPELSSGGVSDAALKQRLQDAQTKSQKSLERAGKG